MCIGVILNSLSVIQIHLESLRLSNKFHNAKLIKHLDSWQNRITIRRLYRIYFAVALRVLYNLLGLLVLNKYNVLCLLLGINLKEEVNLAYYAFRPLCLDRAKDDTEKTCSRIWSGSFYRRILFPPAYFCDLKEMRQLLLESPVALYSCSYAQRNSTNPLST